MAAAGEQEQQAKADGLKGENAAHAANQVPSHSAQNALQTSVEKEPDADIVMEEPTGETAWTGNGDNEPMEVVDVSKKVEILAEADTPAVSSQAEASDGGEKETSGIASTPVLGLGKERLVTEERASSGNEAVEMAVGAAPGEAVEDAATGVEEQQEDVVMVSEAAESPSDTANNDIEAGESAVEEQNGTVVAVEMAATHDAQKEAGSVAAMVSVDVLGEVQQTISMLVDDVEALADIAASSSDPVSATLSVDLPDSPLHPHLSADEAMELLEAHHLEEVHGDLIPDQDEAMLEQTDPKEETTETSEYQWFDGDDEDDEGSAVLEPLSHEEVPDVFGFDDVVDLTGGQGGDAADVDSDGSGDTVVIPMSSSSSSSSASSVSSGSSSSSSSSSSGSSDVSSASEAEDSDQHVSKKRAASRNNGRKLLKYKKQKRTLSSESETKPSPSPVRRKRRRKIEEPVIPAEFDIFDTVAADPILQGAYNIRKNRRACFVGNWGFSESAFHDVDSVSPFEYLSQSRVAASRPASDRRPVSGKYGGFFKLRQFNGTLVKVREDQVDLQFLPFPSSDDEEDDDDDVAERKSDDDEDEDDEDEDDEDEPAAKRYVVLGKGKNRFGRFLIRGYLNPADGRLTVRRRYLD